MIIVFIPRRLSLITVTVTVFEALVLRSRVNPYPGAHRQNETNVFRSWRNESVDHSSFSSVGSLFHAQPNSWNVIERYSKLSIKRYSVNHIVLPVNLLVFHNSIAIIINQIQCDINVCRMSLTSHGCDIVRRSCWDVARRLLLSRLAFHNDPIRRDKKSL